MTRLFRSCHVLVEILQNSTCSYYSSIAKHQKSVIKMKGDVPEENMPIITINLFLLKYT